MPILSRIIAPAEDEILYSYLQRTSRANGISVFSNFIIRYLILDQEPDSHKSHRMHYEANRAVSAILRYLPNWVDPAEFYLSHSCFPIHAPLLDDAQQTLLVNLAFRDQVQTQFPHLADFSIGGMIRELRICPQCRKEDIQNGDFWYYHRMHQLPYVKVCRKHGCALQVFRGTRIRELDDDTFEELTDIRDPDYGYSVFVDDFCSYQYQTNIHGLETAIFRRICELDCGGSSLHRLTQMIRRKKLDYFFPINISRLLLNDLTAYRRSINRFFILPLLYALFDKASDIGRYLPEDRIVGRFLSACTDYHLTGPYRRSIVCLEDRSDGHRFVTTPAGFLMGWRDPKDDVGKTEQDKFNEMFNIAAGGEYRCESGFEGMTRHIDVRHLNCQGRSPVRRLSARQFIEYGARCSCERCISFEQAAAEIQKCGDYELLQFKSAGRVIKVRHRSCGKVFTTGYKLFTQTPFCRAEAFDEEEGEIDIGN